MDYHNLKTLFFTIIVIFWCNVFNEGTYTFETHETPVAPVSDPCLSSPTSPVSDSIPTSSTSALSDPTQASSTSMKKSKKLKPLPQKDDTFLKIRRGKKVFIDKTSYIEELLKDERRPTRIVQRHKDLPTGNTDTKGEWVEYPIVHLTFSEIADYGKKVPSAKLFQTRLYDALQDIADFYKVGDCGRNLDTLVRKLFNKFSLPVVILIDEYDYPFTSILYKRPDGSLTKEEEDLLTGMKATLDRFFFVIKYLIEANEVKLAFVTGVARLTFEADNFVTLTDEYSCMVGFTEDEISQYLGPHIDQFAETEGTSPEEITKKLLKMYGGYIFYDNSKTKVVNPVSVMACLRHGKFRNYWCPTQSLDIVLAKMCAEEARPDEFIHRKVPQASFYESNPTRDEIPTSVYMLLYGYLTIEKYIGSDDTVILNYPNDYTREVIENNFKLHLLLDHEDELRKSGSDVIFNLESMQISALVRFLNKLGFRNQAPAPYQLRIEHEFNATTIMYLIFRAVRLNVEIRAEIKHDNRPLGDLDLLIMTDTMNFAIEVKYELERKDELNGLKQLLGYIAKAEDTFLRFIANRRRQRKLRETSTTFLIAFNVKKDKTGITHSIDSFVAIPYQPGEPCGEEKPMKIWFKRMQYKSETASFTEHLKNGTSDDKLLSLLSERAVW